MGREWMCEMDSISVLDENDLPFEEDVLKNPYALKGWINYLDYRHNSGASFRARNLVYERALKHLPGSYKLWMRYLKERIHQVHSRKKSISDPSYEAVNNAFERALVYLHKMPKVWLLQLDFLGEQHLVTRARKTFDLALQSLPIMQHPPLWIHFLKWARQNAPPETVRRLYRRYLKLEPDHLEQYLEYLKEVGELGEACELLVTALNREDFVSKQGRSRHDLWTDLCDIMTKNPRKVKNLRVDAIIRSGLRQFSDETGNLWCALADFYIRDANFEKARDIYEEAMFEVVTVRDFSQVFDAYTQFEETMAAAQMEVQAEDGQDKETSEDVAQDLDLRLARLEDLMDRRPLLLSSVLLRQNPHNVLEWHKRAKLMHKKGAAAVVKTYTDAVRTVDPFKATGRPHSLWSAFATFYLKHNEVRNARLIFEKGTRATFKTVDDLGALWCEWAEAELGLKKYKEALAVMERATTVPKHLRTKHVDYYDTSLSIHDRVHKHVKLWMFYSDLEESLGTFQSTKAVYERILDLRIATPQIIINYATFLEEHKYFEESFSVFERGIALFNYPHVRDIWVGYLTKFVDRYKDTKLERTRDLFEQCADHVPPDNAKKIYLMYGMFEEKYGLTRRAMAVYDRACDAVEANQRFEMYQHYIARAKEFFGVTHTRQIFEKAIELLPDTESKAMCLQYAELERQLGEVDRARGVLVHGSQFADPQRDAGFWEAWHTFEVRHGNEDTFKEMLRIKRSVQAQFMNKVNYLATEMAGSTDGAPAKNAMEGLEKQTTEAERTLAQQATVARMAAAAEHGGVAFTPATDTGLPSAAVQDTTSGAEIVPPVTKSGTETANPEAIDVDLDDIADGGSDDDHGDIDIEEQPVPTEVFGDAKAVLEEERAQKTSGLSAMELLRMKRMQ